MNSGAILPTGDPVEEFGSEGGKVKFYGGSGNDEIQTNEGNKALVDCAAPARTSPSWTRASTRSSTARKSSTVRRFRRAATLS